ncbi:HAD-IIA family hydrolase [Sphingobacterium thalpophilum]|uniref:HAD-IIA family hydrolase n=1 Tax=Sphingobacterium thalpophilum TaxID=259 RepID=UPI003D9686BA
MNYITNCYNVPGYIFEALEQIKHIVLDLDGTIYKDNTIFPYTIDFLNTLKSLGITYSFLTNNSSMGTSEHLLKLGTMGICVSSRELYTSADATIYFIKTNYPEWRYLFILGTPSLSLQFEKSGFVVLDEVSDKDPDALIVSFDTSLTYASLCRAAWWVKQGKPYFGTHPDLTCPSDQDTILVDCGAICAAIEAATGRKPDKILGKPQAEMLKEIINFQGLHPSEVAMVGDRLCTDILTSRNAGTFGALVLSGETVLDDVRDGIEPQPDLVVPSIKELGELMVYTRVRVC